MPDDKTKSRLTSQLVALGLEDAGRADETSVTQERRAMADAEPLPLSWPLDVAAQARQRRFAAWRVLVPALAAAGLGLVMFKPWQADDGWRVKGAGHAEVYADVGGNVIKLEKGATLPNGAKVRAQVTAAKDTVAFFGIVNAQRALLSDPSALWSDRLTLKGGDKAFFPGSVELVGTAEGETVVVVSCPAATVSDESFASTVKEVMQNQAAGLSGCDVFAQSLR